MHLNNGWIKGTFIYYWRVFQRHSKKLWYKKSTKIDSLGTLRYYNCKKSCANLDHQTPDLACHSTYSGTMSSKHLNSHKVQVYFKREPYMANDRRRPFPNILSVRSSLHLSVFYNSCSLSANHSIELLLSCCCCFLAAFSFSSAFRAWKNNCRQGFASGLILSGFGSNLPGKTESGSMIFSSHDPDPRR